MPVFSKLRNRLSRRQTLKLLGAAGGGLVSILLTDKFLNSDSHQSASNHQNTDWQFPPLEPATQEGAFAIFNVATINIQTKTIEIERKQAEFRTEDLGNSITLDLMLIPSGTFTMGSAEGQGNDNERPQHEVTISPFLMGKHQVTQAQWRAVAALPKIEQDLAMAPSFFKEDSEGDNLPVEGVSWKDAVEFCQRLSQHTGREYRLPSEAEWEYACRAGTSTAFHFGETITTGLANYRSTDFTHGGTTHLGNYGPGPHGEYREKTTEVGSFPANAFGLYDMHGNLWEWCADHWHDNYEGAPSDGTAWETSDVNAERLIRGGAWSFIPDFCRSAYRGKAAPILRDDYVGFRVVCATRR